MRALLARFSIGSIGIFFTYLFLLFYFNNVDVYHHAFFTPGITIIFYNLMRALYILFLGWFFFAAGDGLLRVSARDYQPQEYSLQTFLLAFFTGVGICHVIFFIGGYAGFYNKLFLVAATTMLLAVSLKRLDEWLHHLQVNKLGMLMIALPVLLFMITKGLYPAGGHDYYNHYFPYYRKVIENGNLLPNEVWYHFYYNKGDALYFISMLLTDLLAPQLAATTFIFAGAGVVFLMLNNKATWRSLPWIGVAAYFTFLIYTAGPVDNMHQGGWGDLEKPHEPAAVLMLALIWLSSVVHAKQVITARIALIFSAAALVLITPEMSVFAGIYLFLWCLYSAFQKQWQAVVSTIFGMATIGMVLASILAVNYYLTGMPDDQGILVLWPFLNFAKLSSWGVTLELLFLQNTHVSLMANKTPITSDFLYVMLPFLRLDVWFPLLLTAISLFSVNLLVPGRYKAVMKQLDVNAMLGCLFLIIAIVLLSFVIGRDQPISFYRFTSFAYAPMLCFCLLLLTPLFDYKIMRLAAIVLTIFIVRFMNSHDAPDTRIGAKMQIFSASYLTDNISQVLVNASRFIRGKYSLADAYKNQQGWPGRLPWGGIHPAMETIWKQLPRHTRIWSMNIHSYCMLPDCDVESAMSFRMSQHEDIVFFGAPEAAKKILQQENLNYFFVSNSMSLWDPVTYSPLFSPKHIADTMGIVWTDGDNTLLTWKEQASTPIDSIWLKHYNEKIKKTHADSSYPYNQMRTALNTLQVKGKLDRTDLPW